MELVKKQGRPRFRRVKVTGAQRPGYVRGLAKEQLELLRALKGLHRQRLRLLTSTLQPLVNMPLDIILQAVNENLTMWAPEMLTRAEPTVFRLYSAGLKSGLAEAGMAFGPEIADINVVRFLANQPTGLVPTLQGFVDEERVFVEDTIRRSYEPGVEFDLDSVVKELRKRSPRETYRLERIVRTESRKITGLGRLAGWDMDDRRDHYDYHYIATVDKRTRPQHTSFMREGPYSFEELQVIWTDKREPYNCRCTMARTLKGRQRLVDEGHVTSEEAEDFYSSEV